MIVRPEGGGSGRSVTVGVTGVPVFISFNKVCESFVYIMTIINLMNQTVRARPIAANSFVLAAPRLPKRDWR